MYSRYIARESMSVRWREIERVERRELREEHIGKLSVWNVYTSSLELHPASPNHGPESTEKVNAQAPSSHSPPA